MSGQPESRGAVLNVASQTAATGAGRMLVEKHADIVSAADHTVRGTRRPITLYNIEVRLRPNKSLIDARVKSVTRAADGVGADVVVDVRECTSTDDLDDFIEARPGAELTLFTAEPDAIEAGKSYRLTARVLGGPNGERMVVEAAEPTQR